MKLSADALCVKAQAMYGKRILAQEYAELCNKQSMDDVISFLKKHPSYQDIFKQTRNEGMHRQQLEDIIEKNYYIQCEKLVRYAPKLQQAFFVHEIMYLEVRAIVDKVMYLSYQKTDVFTINLPSQITQKMSFDIYGLLPINSFERLQQYLQGTKYESIITNFAFRGSIDLNVLEQKLIQLYYDKYIRIIKQCFSGKLQQQLMDVLLTTIELQNITRLYRLKKYFNATAEDLENASFLKYKRMSNHLFKQLVDAKDMDTFIQILIDSRYHMNINDDELMYMEHNVEEVRGKLAKKHFRFSKEASLVYLAYCTLQKIEVNNLKHIIEGIRYQKDATNIEEMLIYI